MTRKFAGPRSLDCGFWDGSCLYGVCVAGMLIEILHELWDGPPFSKNGVQCVA